MVEEKIRPSDVWVEIPGNTLEDNLRLLKKFVDSFPLYRVDWRDKFQFPFQGEYEQDRIYKLDISCNTETRNVEKLLNELERTTGKKLMRQYACAQFICDSERIILRAMYPLEKYSIQKREMMGDLFLDYLIENEIDISNK